MRRTDHDRLSRRSTDDEEPTVNQPPTPAPRRSRRRAGGAALAATLLTSLAACSSGGGSSTSATTTPGGTVTAALDSEAVMQSGWQQAIAELGPTAVSTEPTQVDNDMLAASSDGSSTRVQLWRYDGDRWVEDAVLGLTDGFATVSGIEFMDVTNDSHLELFVHFAGILANGAEIFVKDPTGWRATGSYANLVYNNGALSGSQPFCTNSQCTSPINVPFTLTWMGAAGFAQTFYDRTNAMITIMDIQECTDWYEDEALPLTKCDAGDAVILLQAALAEAGFSFSVNGNNGGLVDGLYGPSTATTVRMYQYANGLPVDGNADGQWYYDLVQRYVSRHPNDLPNYVAESCREAMGRMAPGAVINIEKLRDALMVCEHYDFITQMENRGQALLHGLPAEQVLDGYCNDVYDYFYYSIDWYDLYACNIYDDY